MPRIDPRVQRLLLRSREFVWRHFQPTKEEVTPEKDSVVVWFGVSGKKNPWAVYAAPFRAHVTIGFFDGASLPDPDGILKGTGKQLRLVHIKTADDLGGEPLAAVLRAARAATISRDADKKPRR